MELLVSRQYTVIEVSKLPYPAGLGKLEYRRLEHRMRKLLGAEFGDPAANERMFWTPQYQHVIATYLEPEFAGVDIVSVARAAAEAAQASDVYGQVISHEKAYERYSANLPPRGQYNTQQAANWTLSPPRLEYDGPNLIIGDGRHRLSLLRSIVEPQQPDFPVLVQLFHD